MCLEWQNQTRAAKLWEGTMSLGFASSRNKAEIKSITTEDWENPAPAESGAGICIAPVPQAAPCTGTPQPPASHQAILGAKPLLFQPLSCLFSPTSLQGSQSPRSALRKGRERMLSRGGVAGAPRSVAEGPESLPAGGGEQCGLCILFSSLLCFLIFC